MKNLNFLTHLDDNPSTLSLQFNKKSQYRTKTSGFFSLLAYLTILFIAIYKIYDVLCLNHIEIQTQVSMTEYKRPIHISDMVFSLWLRAMTDSGFIEINDTNKYQFGINITLQQNYIYLKNGQPKQIMITHPMHSDPNNNYYTINHAQSIDSQLFGRTDLSDPTFTNGDVYKRLAIRVNKCDEDIDRACRPYQSNVNAALIFTNNRIDPYQGNQSKIVWVDPAHRVYQMLSLLNQFQCFSLTYFFKAANITIDSSILPEIVHTQPNEKNTRNISSWIYDNQYIQEIFNLGEDNEDLFKVALKRSQYSIYYRRSYKKLDTVLAQVFGLVGLVFLVKGIIVGGYNSWRFKRERIGVINRGRNGDGDEKQEGSHYGRYLWQKFCSFITCRCLCRKPKNNPNDSEPYLDYHELLVRVEELELQKNPKSPKQEESEQKIMVKQEETQNIPEKQEEVGSELEQNLIEKEKRPENEIYQGRVSIN